MKEAVCPKCSGTGWEMVRADDIEFARKCDCQAEDTNMRKAERANIPPRFLGAGLEWGYQPDPKSPTQSKAKKAALKFIDDYPAVSKGLLFQGTIGLGKTSILCSIGYELIRTKGVEVYYIDWNDLVREMRSGEDHSTRDFAGINQLINKLSQVELLLFDELGASRLSPWVYDNIYYLFNRRYNNNKITVCATNFHDRPNEGGETLNQRVGERIRSRLYEMTVNIEVKGSDFRRKMLGGN
ncbi:MAG: ATP-binding protein [bacterium]|nr:ATP-binding protein [bacterium]